MSFSVYRDLVGDTGGQRRTFFELVFGSSEGWISLGFKKRDTNKMQNYFFEYPRQLKEMLDAIDVHCQDLVHAYFCPNLFKTNVNRKKGNVKVCTNIWADVDDCDPRLLHKAPSILIETSPKRYQALWLLEEPLEPDSAEEISRRIAYGHHRQGVDTSGWDLTQLLRIPYTPNYKYGDLKTAPIVTIIHANRSLYRPSDFDSYPVIEAVKETLKPFNEVEIPDYTSDQLIERYGLDTESLFDRYFYNEPVEDWSKDMWSFILFLFEKGLNEEEAFILARESACNKYERDGRPETDLWKEVQRAKIKKIEVMKLAPTPTARIPRFLTAEELDIVAKRTSFVEKYIHYAENLTDASPQYHQAGAFIILSALLSGNVKLKTSFGDIIPNMWFMILGNTTLTRKTTAMNIAMKMLYSIDEELLLATDGSLEGILIGLRDRPGRPSIFKRDEFTGLLEVIANRDYMAGFAEQLTQLYDNQPIKRLLRKETIDIRNPVFLMYVGGIKAKTQMMMTEELVMGGFIPRFVMITGEPDLSRLRPIGPPTPIRIEERETLKNELMDIYSHYGTQATLTRHGEVLGKAPAIHYVELTPSAWKRYNEYEQLLLQTALDIGYDYLTPVYDRLAKSTLKAAILIAASMQRSDKVIIDLPDLLHAIKYAVGWREYASEIINGVGKTYDERLIDRIYDIICSSDLGATKSELMTMFHLDAKRADLIFKTMEQRALITLVTTNGQKRYQRL